MINTNSNKIQEKIASCWCINFSVAAHLEDVHSRTQQALKQSEVAEIVRESDLLLKLFSDDLDIDEFLRLRRLSVRAAISATSCWQAIKPHFNKVSSSLASTRLMVPNVVFTQSRWGCWEQSQTHRKKRAGGPECHDWGLGGHRKHSVKSLLSLVMIVRGELWWVPVIVTGSLVRGHRHVWVRRSGVQGGT